MPRPTITRSLYRSRFPGGRWMPAGAGLGLATIRQGAGHDHQGVEFEREENAMDSESAMVKMDVLFGSVELQQKHEIEGLGIQCYHRSIHRDQHGAVTTITDWSPSGRLYFEEPTGLFAWFERRRLEKELRGYLPMLRG